jgi:hypothetical protein
VTGIGEGPCSRCFLQFAIAALWRAAFCKVKGKAILTGQGLLSFGRKGEILAQPQKTKHQIPQIIGSHQPNTSKNFVRPSIQKRNHFWKSINSWLPVVPAARTTNPKRPTSCLFSGNYRNADGTKCAAVTPFPVRPPIGTSRIAICAFVGFRSCGGSFPFPSLPSQ